MSDLVRTPPFLFTYWNPFSKDSSLVRSWFDYVKDTSLAEYTADSLGRYMAQTSYEQSTAINSTGRNICGAMFEGFSGLQNQLNETSKQLAQVRDQLQGVNQRLGLLMDEAKTSNVLLENMGELLRIPDSQKQRQHHIELGLKFLKNALRDEDLYQDALHELLDAERLMPSDYFVLHRIGMIYLYVPALGNLEQALAYFSRAAKYAFVESHPNAARLNNILNKNGCKKFAEQTEPSSADLNALAAESYYEAATSLYALGRFEEAVKMAEKAVKCLPEEGKYHFFLAKYLTRSGKPDSAVSQLQQAVELVPEMALATLGDFDLNRSQPILELLEALNNNATSRIRHGISVLKEWPPGDHRYQPVQQWIADAQTGLEKGNFAEKVQLVKKCPNEDAEILPLLLKAQQCKAGTVRWKKDFERAKVDKGRPPAPAIGVGGTVYAQLGENLCALDGATGDELWTWVAQVESIVIGVEGVVYVGLGPSLFCVDGQTGEPLWEFRKGIIHGSDYKKELSTGNILGQPAIGADGTVYVGFRRSFYALDVLTGETLWKFAAPSEVSLRDRNMRFQFKPAIGADGTVYVGFLGSLYALDGRSGKKLWEAGRHEFFDAVIAKNVEYEYVCTPAIGADGAVYVGFGSSLYALEGRTGKRLWKFDSAIHGDSWFNIDSCFILTIGAEGVVYLPTGRGIYALEGRTGKALLELKDEQEEFLNPFPALGVDGTVYVGSEHPPYFLYALDGRTGKTIWKFKTGDGPRNPAIGADGTVYFGSVGGDDADHFGIVSVDPDGEVNHNNRGGGGFYAINSTSVGLGNSPWPMFGQNPQRTGCAAKPHFVPVPSQPSSALI